MIPKPSSICKCGHLGYSDCDGGDHHAGCCSVCDCREFEWADWVPEIKAWLASPIGDD